MNESPITLKELIKISILSLFVVIVIIFLQISNKQTKIVFCNVGQGDAAYLRINNKIDVLVDAGPDNTVLNCLGKYMPFWDKKIEIALLSHHDKDHYQGYNFIINRYQIDNFITIDYRFDTQSYNQLENKIKNNKTNFKTAFKGDKMTILNSVFIFYWPPKDFKSYDSNDYSLVFTFQKKDFRLLFTGDSSNVVMNKLSYQSINKVDILKVPHHGSKNGLTMKFLELADPKIAVISVDKNNSYGHPHKEILDMFKAKNIIIKRTDVDGDIIFKLKESP